MIDSYKLKRGLLRYPVCVQEATFSLKQQSKNLPWISNHFKSFFVHCINESVCLFEDGGETIPILMIKTSTTHFKLMTSWMKSVISFLVRTPNVI